MVHIKTRLLFVEIYFVFATTLRVEMEISVDFYHEYDLSARMG